MDHKKKEFKGKTVMNVSIRSNIHYSVSFESYLFQGAVPKVLLYDGLAYFDFSVFLVEPEKELFPERLTCFLKTFSTPKCF